MRIFGVNVQCDMQIVCSICGPQVGTKERPPQLRNARIFDSASMDRIEYAWICTEHGHTAVLSGNNSGIFIDIVFASHISLYMYKATNTRTSRTNEREDSGGGGRLATSRKKKQPQFQYIWPITVDAEYFSFIYSYSIPRFFHFFFLHIFRALRIDAQLPYVSAHMCW